jgi:putative pyoverdin transport system ATP-binding/permease protein
MGLFTLFSSKAPNRVFLSILLGALAGISYALLIPIVLGSFVDGIQGTPDRVANSAHFLGYEISNYRFALLFAGICLFILLARTLSQILLSRVALDATTDLRIRVYRYIIRAPVAELEALGPSRLIAAITTDVGRIINGAVVVPNVLVALVTLLGMLTYLFFLNADVFWFVIGAIAFGVVTYQVPMYIGNKYFERGRANIDTLQEAIRGLIYGVKELKLGKEKRERYFDDILLPSEYAVNRNAKGGNTIVTAAANYGDLLSFFVIGVVAYVFVSYHSITTASLVGVIMALLYITGPVSLILNSIGQIAMAQVSLRNVNRIFTRLSQEPAADTVAPLPPWRSVVFENVSYRYGEADSGFALQPQSFEIVRGEVTFIVGGNGSGKSTLSKLISMHYVSASGSIHFGETLVDLATINSCRQCVSAIFTDYYLFDRLLGALDEHTQAQLLRYLAELELDKKVSVDDGRFSTTALSDGQRKRLALLVTFIEDREIYLFDEWAADQDPRFKEVFYHTILPALRERDKAVVVISHDDRYFHVADKVLVMEDGQLIRTDRPRSHLLETPAAAERIAVQ